MKLLEYWGKSQSSYETNKYVGNLMRLILEEVIMSDSVMLDGQLQLFLLLFFIYFFFFLNTERISFNEDWLEL